MAGKKGNKKHANKTSYTSDIMQNNSNAEKWTFDEAKNVFIKIYENSINNKDVLCLQDAYFESDIAHSTFYYLISKYPVLDNIRKDIQNDIIRRVNKNALIGDFNPTASIWRMKQLGEKDQTEIKTENKTEIKIDEKKIKEIIDKLEDSV